jgi:hypothetical protein
VWGNLELLMNAQKIWAGLGAAMLLAACAATPNARTAGAAPAAPEDPSCLHDTGSRIADPNQKCRGVGRSYTNTQIEQTGATTTGEALRLLDPSIQIGH